MFTEESLQLFQQTVQQAQSIFICVSSQVKLDQAASALALAAGLKQLGKEVTLLSPSQPTEDLTSLDGVAGFTQQIGNQNLQVAFAYQPDAVDKVSYNIDEEAQKFYLVIQPKKGTPPLDAQSVEFSYTGAHVDLIITIGLTSLASLDGLYEDFTDVFNDTNIASIHAFETDYGTIRLNTSGAAAFSEATTKLLSQLGVTLTPEIANNLLAGLEIATDHFHSTTMTADTFETIAQLLRAGGHRLATTKANSQSNNVFSLPTQAQTEPAVNNFASATRNSENNPENGSANNYSTDISQNNAVNVAPEQVVSRNTAPILENITAPKNRLSINRSTTRSKNSRVFEPAQSRDMSVKTA